MKTSYIVSHLLLLLLIFSGRADRVSIPERTCHKVIPTSQCETQCSDECSKEPSGSGICQDSTCSCTYYCEGPPK
ncbi:unnamed protein product [Lupinus luteus]|uniref:Uncharacterized protein n=1 Tax=Lupinus luteus TaxID=3873 RepID=A0AAV1XYH8_LUPLU